MCQTALIRGFLRRKPRTSLNDHPLAPFRHGQSDTQSPQPVRENVAIQEAIARHEGNSNDVTVQHDPSPIQTNPDPSPVRDGAFLGPTTVVAETAHDDPSLATDPQTQPVAGDLQIQPGCSSATEHPTVRASWWYCHVCHNGPQGIQTPSCTGMTATGICGHVRCNLCTTE